jgi:hypothetical protein
MEVENLGPGKDFKLFPGGGKRWWIAAREDNASV